MAVKRSQSATRVLSVLEGVAHHQPVGVSALAKHLGDDKSAVQRAIMTLADAGWLRAAGGSPTRWELTAHILAVAQAALASNNLRQRARKALETLRAASAETVLLTVPDVGQLIVVETIEGPQSLRTVAAVGTLVPARTTAAGRAMLPYMDVQQQTELLGAAPDRELLQAFSATREKGYAVSAGLIQPETTAVAAPIFGLTGQPIGAVVVSGPSTRLNNERQMELGEMVLATARGLSLSSPQAVTDCFRDHSVVPPDLQGAAYALAR